jgi:diguanylate cyclase (GGDEF)-like protein
VERARDKGLELIDGGGFGGDTRRPASGRKEEAVVATAETDPITGLMNRRGLDPVLAREWDLSRRRGVPSILVIAEIDGFKRLNESGREAGDRALKIVARVLTESCRATDVVARIGTDDFVAILVGAKGDQPASFVKRVSKRLAEGDPAPTLAYGWSKLINATGPQHAVELAEALMYKRRAVSRTRAV